MKKAGRILVGLIAASMAMGSIASVSAATAGEVNSTADKQNVGSLKGTGALEGNVNTKVIKVVLPTNSLNFTIDPIGLIKATGGAKLKAADKKNVLANIVIQKDVGGTLTTVGESDTGAGVFFTTVSSDGTTATLANVATLEVVNKSSSDVKITPSIALTGIKGALQIASNANAFSEAEGPMVGFSMTCTYDKRGENGKEADVSLNNGNAVFAAASATTAKEFTLAGAPGNYAKVFASGKYQYILKPDELPTDPSKIPAGLTSAADQDLFYRSKFIIKGECSDGQLTGWDKITDKPTLEVTWKIEDAPTT